MKRDSLQISYSYKTFLSNILTQVIDYKISKKVFEENDISNLIIQQFLNQKDWQDLLLEFFQQNYAKWKDKELISLEKNSYPQCKGVFFFWLNFVYDDILFIVREVKKNDRWYFQKKNKKCKKESNVISLSFYKNKKSKK